jgi:hypothetical protein
VESDFVEARADDDADALVERAAHRQALLVLAAHIEFESRS